MHTIKSLPSYHNTPIFYHLQVLHQIFGQVPLTIAADQNNLSCILYEQLVFTGHFDSSTAETLCSHTPSLNLPLGTSQIFVQVGRV